MEDQNRSAEEAGEFRGRVLSELKALKEGSDRIESSVTEYKTAIGKRMGDVEVALGEVRGNVNLLMWVIAKISTPILGSIGVAMVAVIGWYFLKSGKP